MKIVHVNGGGETGGGKSHLLALLPQLRRLGADASLLCFSAGLLSQEAQEQGIPTHTLHVSSMLSPRLMVGLYQYFKTLGPDIVHTHGGRANLYGRLAAKLAGVPLVITTVHSHTDLDYTSPWQNMWFSTVDRATWGLADGLIAVSCELQRALLRRGLKQTKVRVVYNGIEDVRPKSLALHEEFSLPADSDVLCAVGRLVPVKRFDLLLTAMRKVVETNPNAILLIVGDGPLEQQLRETSVQIGLGAHVKFVGYRRDAKSIMESSVAFVMSSEMEGLPIVLLEALAGEVPIVATSVGGIPEVITTEENGLLVAPLNSGALAEAIVRVLARPLEAQERAVNGRKWFEEYATAEAMARKTLSVYIEWGDRQ
ncbi:MAG: group 1 glycosyl transferase [Bacillota bacterium]|nr:MAG: group 1 glycosyl transferase [Bacillota bacterium]MBS3950399.1 glycosyltransferase [Peptococcaceae bacterium]